LTKTESTDIHYLENRAPLRQKHAGQQAKKQPQKNPHKAGFAGAANKLAN
jgi:hypothetical protein